MQNKSFLFFLLLFGSISLIGRGQVNTYSPYSRFGLGELARPGFGQDLSMGSSGIALRSPKYINGINPAASTAQDTMSFLFDFGLNASNTTYETNTLSSTLNNMNIHHIAISFPVTRWWSATAGVIPFSSVGYNILEQRSDPEIGLFDYYFEGNGGLNRFFLGTSVKLLNRISLGVDMSYHFGFMEYSRRVEFPNDNYAAVTNIDTRYNIRDVVWNLGLQYHEEIANRYFITLGAIYNPETSMNADRIFVGQNSFPGRISENNPNISPFTEITRIEDQGDITYPRKYGTGLALGIKNQLTLTGDYTKQEWSNSKIFGNQDSLVNSSTFNFGAEFTPEYDALRGYLRRIHYRVGGYYSNTYLQLRGEQLKDYGITFGVGLPFRGTKTTFNLSVVLGQRGTLSNNLIRENYGIINLSFTLHDFWFYKRKFD